ncbi:hypothetical protein R1flu_023955 [Riccia fluitans]|uniref:Uncharacterized protein n=1 Tax=Riccia fluitans TaxID=41844 RepID=A0ABD1XTH3_9MARC
MLLAPAMYARFFNEDTVENVSLNETLWDVSSCPGCAAPNFGATWYLHVYGRVDTTVVVQFRRHSSYRMAAGRLKNDRPEEQTGMTADVL